MKECDLIMKGGITSGVVYPHAIRNVAAEYRLRSIGGTSAGAIAAALAAAAEYRRQENAGTMAGFDSIGGVAKELSTGMRDLFQPSPPTAPLFRLLLASVDHESGGLLRAVPKVFSKQLTIGGVLCSASIILGVLANNWALAVLGVVLSCLATVWLIALSVKRIVVHDLPAQDFGLCSGKTESNGVGPAFGDWIAEKIDQISGKSGDPLTIGDLRAHKIELATMTTDLSSGRPYRLPLQTRIHVFSKAEFDRLFPANIVEYLCHVGGRHQDARSGPDAPKDLYRLPVGDDFPVYLVTRMSLSFPGLISGVPLWRPDFQRNGVLRRCLFSDGGISSNFPIYFFDNLLPGRPTFGISLTSWNAEAHGDRRVDMPKGGTQSSNLPIKEINSLASFAAAIVNTAKDWQDTMQSLLPGYAERIVSVRLDDTREGGLNLAMPEEVITKLAEYGAKAGEALVNEFDLENHRLKRARALFDPLEGALVGFARAYDDDYHALLAERGDPNSKVQSREVFAALGADLKAIGEKAQALQESEDRRSIRQSKIISVDAEVRLVAADDRIPADARGWSAK